LLGWWVPGVVSGVQQQQQQEHGTEHHAPGLLSLCACVPACLRIPFPALVNTEIVMVFINYKQRP
jgi:hypothetical protein